MHPMKEKLFFVGGSAMAPVPAATILTLYSIWIPTGPAFAPLTIDTLIYFEKKAGEKTEL